MPHRRLAKWMAATPTAYFTLAVSCLILAFQTPERFNAILAILVCLHNLLAAFQTKETNRVEEADKATPNERSDL